MKCLLTIRLLRFRRTVLSNESMCLPNITLKIFAVEIAMLLNKGNFDGNVLCSYETKKAGLFNQRLNIVRNLG